MIKAIYDAGISDIIYYLFHVLGFISVFLFNIWYGKKYKITVLKSILTTLIVYPIVYIWIYIQFWIESGFTKFGGNNIVRGFVYIPIFAIISSKILKIEWKKTCDFIAPCISLCHAVSHIGCIFEGCCRGYVSAFGIYNPITETNLFPVQLFESLTAFAIVLFIVLRAKKINYTSDGKSFPIMIMLFGITRFFWEFARNNNKLIWGISNLAFHALFMAVVGLIIYIILIVREKKLKKNEAKK